MSLFGLLPSDLQVKLQPVAGEQTFLIDDEGDLTEAMAVDILQTAEDRLLMRLEHRYRQLLRRVDGEILVGRAAGGETVLQCGMFPLVSGTVKVWKNFPSEGLWTARNPVLALSTGEYSVNLTTGAVTLVTALVAGDSIYIEYDHTGAARVLALRDMALTLAAMEVARRLAFFRDGEGFDRLEGWKTDVYTDLDNMKCVDVLDRLDLVREDTEPDNFYRRVLMS